VTPNSSGWESGYQGGRFPDACCADIVQVKQAFQDHVRGAEGSNHTHIDTSLQMLRADLVALSMQFEAQRKEMRDELASQRRWQYTIMGGLTVLVMLASWFGRDIVSVVFHL